MFVFLGHLGDEPACSLAAFAAREDVGRTVDPDFGDGCCAASQGGPALHSPHVDLRHGRFPSTACAPGRVTVALQLGPLGSGRGAMGEQACIKKACCAGQPPICPALPALDAYAATSAALSSADAVRSEVRQRGSQPCLALSVDRRCRVTLVSLLQLRQRAELRVRAAAVAPSRRNETLGATRWRLSD